ncbi:MAG: M15 family metallopeptidase [Treponema sp.]|nr:M15 family metallopeptidase [Treponema sp.]
MRIYKIFTDRKRRLFFLVPALAIFTWLVVQKILTIVYAQDMPEESGVIISEMDWPETIMKVLSAAYPDRIGPVEFRNDDWAFTIGEKWFYYADGRFLPEELKDAAEDYRAMGFNFNYPQELPAWESTAEQRAARTLSAEEGRRIRQTQTQPARPAARRPLFFFEALWNISSRDQAWEQQSQIDFLGHSLSIHSGISQTMILIDEIITNESKTSPAVRQWIDNLGTVAGWNWRSVASSGNRSMHSYGIAIDLLPKNLGGLATYWLWTARDNPQWWNIPYSGRYHPPDEVIRTFESFGFIWGGKWGNYDTMHFEYRPEIFILRNIPRT